MKKMKAVCAKGDGTVEVVEVPAPDITDDYECLVRVTACGLCSGADLKIIGYGSVGEMPIEYPTLVGHEVWAAFIEKVGGKKLRNYKVGDRVACPSGLTGRGLPAMTGAA